MTCFDSLPDPGTEELRLVALHGLRLKGFTETSTVGEHFAVDEADLERTMKGLVDEELVLRRDGERNGWILTEAGRIENERLLADELHRSGKQAAVEAAYADFRLLNPRLLAVCCDWQVSDVDNQVLNDHADPDYDRLVVDALVAVDVDARPLLADLADALDRFGTYGPRLTNALAKLQQGDQRWFTKPTIDSYHTVWFELHEDLLATLGLDRAAEAS